MPRPLDRSLRLLYLDGMTGASEITLGTLIDEVKAAVIEDLRADAPLAEAIAAAVAKHLTASATLTPA